MARVTVEDCIDKIPSRFELVSIAAQRAHAISAGAPITVERSNDKNAVIALREIADGTVNVEILRDSLIRKNQEKVSTDAYGVEEVSNVDSEGVSQEVSEEMSALQGDVSASDDDNSLLYGDAEEISSDD